MYNPINNLGITAFMRWPALALPITGLLGFFSGSLIGAAIAWIASVAIGVYATNKVFKKQLCDCEGEYTKKGWGLLPKVNWFVEYSPETGSKKPWDLYSMFGDDVTTKQHYGSYGSEENALAKKTLMESITNNSTDEKK